MVTVQEYVFIPLLLWVPISLVIIWGFMMALCDEKNRRTADWQQLWYDLDDDDSDE